MNRIYLTILIISGLVIHFQIFSQTHKGRIQPGRLYEAGATLYAPRYGFVAKVPEGWEGLLPRESEVFLLNTTTPTIYGEVFVFGRDQGDLLMMQEAWKKGFDLTGSVKLKAINSTLNDFLLAADVIAEGQYINRGMKGFAVARCNPTGPCVTTLMIAPVQFFDSIRNTVMKFMKEGSFQAPSNASPYADFDWKEFLSNKTLMTYETMEGGSKKNIIDLCKDGTFQSSITHKGIFKNTNPDYRGSNAGQWEVKGSGETTTINFTFKRKGLEPFSAVLMIQDEKVTSNGDRYFVGFSEKCK
jgi:hypothetical protein